MSNVIDFPKQSDETLLFTPEGAVLLALFAAYQDKMPKALAMFDLALNVAEARGFTKREALINYAQSSKNEPEGRNVFDLFLRFVGPFEFFEMNGAGFVVGGGA